VIIFITDTSGVIVNNPMAEVFAGLVRLHRQTSFPNQTTAAKELGYDQSWLSRVETGQHVPDRETVVRMEQRFGCVPGTLMITYEALVKEALPDSVRQWLPYEQHATMLQTFQHSVVPGLLQTSDYARAILVEEPAVRARIDRQAILSREDAPMLTCFIEEPVLLRDVGGAQVMRDQLEHLVRCVSSRVIVQVVPLCIHESLRGSFVLAADRDGEVGFIEAATGGLVTTSDVDMANLKMAWKSLRDVAYPLVDTLELIRKVKEERWS
jgi:transcriptional regulator with XRE-family HTH domain